jgi:hypothetical protein
MTSGVNMYEFITQRDEPEINFLTQQGYTTDDAVLLIYQRTYRSRNPNTYIPVPQQQQRVRPRYVLLCVNIF